MNSPPVPDELVFYGIDGTECNQFTAKLLRVAFDNGKLRDNIWIADMAAMGFRDEALRWWLDLDEDIQGDWRRLKTAMVARWPRDPAKSNEIYPTSSIATPAAAPPQPPPYPQVESLDSAVANLRLNETQANATRTHSIPPSRSTSLIDNPAWSHIPHDHEFVSSPLRSNSEARSAFPNEKEKEGSENGSVDSSTAIINPPTPTPALQPAGRIHVKDWHKSSNLESSLPKSEEAWLEDARQRREAWDKSKEPRASAYWVLVEEGEEIPHKAIRTGRDTNGDPLFTSRTWYEGGLHPGKCGRHLTDALITWEGDEVGPLAPYEVLVGKPSALQWVPNPWTRPATSKEAPSISMRPFDAVEGGMDEGKPLLLVQAHKEGYGWQPGKVAVGAEECEIGWAFNAHKLKDFRILVWP